MRVFSSDADYEEFVATTPAYVRESGFPAYEDGSPNPQISFCTAPGGVVTPVGAYIPGGFYLKGWLRILGWNVRAEIIVSTERLFIDIACDPLDLGPFQLQRSEDNAIDGPKFYVDIRYSLLGATASTLVDIEGYTCFIGVCVGVKVGVSPLSALRAFCLLFLNPSA